MHIMVYLMAALVLLGGFGLASDLTGKLSTMVIIQTIFSAVLLATFGRIEQHLGSLVDIARSQSLTQGTSDQVGPDTRDVKVDEPLIMGQPEASDSPVAETGEVMGRKFKLFEDGTVEVMTLSGAKRFRSVEEAVAYLR